MSRLARSTELLTALTTAHLADLASCTDVNDAAQTGRWPIMVSIQVRARVCQIMRRLALTKLCVSADGAPVELPRCSGGIGTAVPCAVLRRPGRPVRSRCGGLPPERAPVRGAEADTRAPASAGGGKCSTLDVAGLHRRAECSCISRGVWPGSWRSPQRRRSFAGGTPARCSRQWRLPFGWPCGRVHHRHLDGGS